MMLELSYIARKEQGSICGSIWKHIVLSHLYKLLSLLPQVNLRERSGPTLRQMFPTSAGDCPRHEKGRDSRHGQEYTALSVVEQIMRHDSVSDEFTALGESIYTMWWAINRYTKCLIPYSQKIWRGLKFGALAIWFEIVNIKSANINYWS